jgi:hypothetical protein
VWKARAATAAVVARATLEAKTPSIAADLIISVGSGRLQARLTVGFAATQ